MLSSGAGGNNRGRRTGTGTGTGGSGSGHLSGESRPSTLAAPESYSQQNHHNNPSYQVSGSTCSRGRIGGGGNLVEAGHETGEEYRRTAAEVFKDAQDASSSLKQLLTSQPPWSRDVEAERTKARNLYLVLLFNHPLSTYAQSIDHFWLNTSYTIIAAYRDTIARLETAANAAAVAAAGGGSGGGRRKGGGGGGGHEANDPRVIELRKTLTRFRQALGSEETYYRSLISRIVGFYQLQQQAASHLAILDIGVPDSVHIPEQTSGGSGGRSTVSGLEYGLAPILSREESEKKIGLVYKGLICLGDIERYKEQYSERARREAREGIKDRSVRDNERYARAKSYYEVARGLQPDNGAASNQLAVVSGYLSDHFVCIYHYFRALAVKQPFPGGEANLERALKKVFDKWRATRQQQQLEKKVSGEDGAGMAGSAPLGDPVAENVESFKRDFIVILAIIFARAGTSHLGQLQSSALPLFAQLVTARNLPSETIVKATAMVIGSHWHARLGASTTAGSSSMITDSDAEQPIHTLGPGRQEGDGTRQTLPKARKSVEDLSLTFLLAFFGVLLRVSNDEVQDALHAATSGSAIDDTADPISQSIPTAEPQQHQQTIASTISGDLEHELELAQHISAVLRRILPSLRIISRWTKNHLDYLSRCSRSSNSELVWSIEEFWARYKQLMLSFARLFPLGQMPALDEPLEEDIDMRGFLPLRRGLTNAFIGSGGSAVGENQGMGEIDQFGQGVGGPMHREVHPNEEQLMRIADLLVDVKLLMQTEAGSVALKIAPTSTVHSESITVPSSTTSNNTLTHITSNAHRNQYTNTIEHKGQDVTDNENAKRENDNGNENEREQDMASVSTETEDDPVNLAMRATLGEGSSVGEIEDRYSPDIDEDEDEDEEEVILWGRNTPPVLSHRPTHDLFQSLALSHDQSINEHSLTGHQYQNQYRFPQHQQHSQHAHSHPHAHAHPSPTDNPAIVTGGGGTITSGPSGPGSSSPRLLFGSGTGGEFGSGASSIWTMSREESQSQQGIKRPQLQPSQSRGQSQPQSQSQPQQSQSQQNQESVHQLNQKQPTHQNPPQMQYHAHQNIPPPLPSSSADLFISGQPQTSLSSSEQQQQPHLNPLATQHQPISSIWSSTPRLASPSSPGILPTGSAGASGMQGIWSSPGGGVGTNLTFPSPPAPPGISTSSSASSSFWAQPMSGNLGQLQQHPPRSQAHSHVQAHAHGHNQVLPAQAHAHVHGQGQGQGQRHPTSGQQWSGYHPS